MKIALIIETLILAAILLRWIVAKANAAIDDYNDRLRKKERAAARWMEHEATRHERFADLSRQIGDAV